MRLPLFTGGEWCHASSRPVIAEARQRPSAGVVDHQAWCSEPGAGGEREASGRSALVPHPETSHPEEPPHVAYTLPLVLGRDGGLPATVTPRAAQTQPRCARPLSLSRF